VTNKGDAALGALAADKCEATTVTGIRTFVQHSSVDEKLGSCDKWDDIVALETLRGVGSPCSHARHLAHKAPVSSRTLRDSREPAGTQTKANGSELESRKSWSCQASQQGLRHGPKPLSNKQGRLGIARQPATGRDMELWDSNSVRDESHTKFRREFCCLGLARAGQGDKAIGALLQVLVECSFVQRGHSLVSAAPLK
jgi:hypothetical protein